MSRIDRKIVNNKINRRNKDSEADKQVESHAGMSAIDKIFFFPQRTEKVTRNEEVHLFFVDLKEGGDTVPLSYKTMINIRMYKHQSSQIPI